MLGKFVIYVLVLLVLMVIMLILMFISFCLVGVIGLVAILLVGLGMFSLWIFGLFVGFNLLFGCVGFIGVVINGFIVVIVVINVNLKVK